MLNQLSDDLKKVFLAGIGALAMGAEKSEALVKELVKKGEITLEQGKILNEELKHRVKKQAASSVDVEAMTAEERAALKRRLEEMEQKENEEPKRAE